MIDKLNMLLINSSSALRTLTDRNDDPIFQQIDDLIAQNSQLRLDVQKWAECFNALEIAFINSQNGRVSIIVLLMIAQFTEYQNIVDEVNRTFQLPNDTGAPDIDRESEAKLQVFQMTTVALQSSIRRQYIFN